MQLLDGFFRSPAVEPLFADVATVQSILDFEAALARAEARAGLIPQDSAAAISASCRADLLYLPALRQAVANAGNLAIPLVKELTAIVARSSPDAARYVHYGATSQDALDTGLFLQLRSATRRIQQDLDSIAVSLADLTARHQKTLLPARTWMQQALPTTFGFITAGWLDACLSHCARLEHLLGDSLALQFGGASGTLAALHDRGAEVALLLSEELALPLPLIPWHAQRERISEVAAAYGLLAGTLSKIARDLSLHMQTEVGELSEPGATGRGGSSTMPHKQNPVACAAILATTSRVPALVSTILDSLSGEYQRSLGAWQSEWETVPEIVRLAAGASHHLAALLPRLVVNSDRMRANLELTNGLIYAEAVTFALSKKIDRFAAHRLVEGACRRAQSEQRHLREVLCGDREVGTLLDSKSLHELFEPANYLGSAHRFIEAVLTAAHSRFESPKSIARG
jgi:3-carboxy-cis,cis-muconate cycloisomerase